MARKTQDDGHNGAGHLRVISGAGGDRPGVGAMKKKYEYACAEWGDEYHIMRKRVDDAMWEVLSVVDDRNLARDMVGGLNRGELASTELEPGQELVTRK